MGQNYRRVNSALSLDWKRLICGWLPVVGRKLALVTRGRLEPVEDPTSRS